MPRTSARSREMAAHFAEQAAYRALEDRKLAAYAVLHGENSTCAERIAAAEEVLRAQYERSLDRAERAREGGDHPDFGTYVRMRDLENLEAFPASIVGALRKTHGKRQPGVIPDGRSFWCAPKVQASQRASRSARSARSASH